MNNTDSVYYIRKVLEPKQLEDVGFKFFDAMHIACAKSEKAVSFFLFVNFVFIKIFCFFTCFFSRLSETLYRPRIIKLRTYYEII